MGRTTSALLDNLSEQVYFLHTGSVAFDHGADIEAKRLSVHLRLLFHETAMSKSLLGQLGHLETTAMYDTARPMHRGEGASTGEYSLVYVAMGQNRFVPNLDNEFHNGPRWGVFADWWRTPILQDAEGFTLTREALVLGMAHEDGGAHVDPEMSTAYSRFLEDSLGWGTTSPSGKHVKMRSPLFASVRQLAHETLVSMAKSGYPVFPAEVPRRRYLYLPGPTIEQVYGATMLIGGTVLHGETLDGAPMRNPVMDSWPDKVDRNDPCPCGSGRKYKKCHGC